MLKKKEKRGSLGHVEKKEKRGSLGHVEKKGKKRVVGFIILLYFQSLYKSLNAQIMYSLIYNLNLTNSLFQNFHKNTYFFNKKHSQILKKSTTQQIGRKCLHRSQQAPKLRQSTIASNTTTLFLLLL